MASCQDQQVQRGRRLLCHKYHQKFLISGYMSVSSGTTLNSGQLLDSFAVKIMHLPDVVIIWSSERLLDAQTQHL